MHVIFANATAFLKYLAYKSKHLNSLNKHDMIKNGDGEMFALVIASLVHLYMFHCQRNMNFIFSDI